MTCSLFDSTQTVMGEGIKSVAFTHRVICKLGCVGMCWCDCHFGIIECKKEPIRKQLIRTQWNASYKYIYSILARTNKLICTFFYFHLSPEHSNVYTFCFLFSPIQTFSTRKYDPIPNLRTTHTLRARKISMQLLFILSSFHKLFFIILICTYIYDHFLPSYLQIFIFKYPPCAVKLQKEEEKESKKKKRLCCCCSFFIALDFINTLCVIVCV